VPRKRPGGIGTNSFAAQLDLNRVRQTPGGSRRSAFIYPLPTKRRAVCAAPLSFTRSQPNTGQLAPLRFHLAGRGSRRNATNTPFSTGLIDQKRCL